MGNWIKDRWTVVKEALGPRRFVFGITVTTIVGAFDWIEQQFRTWISHWFRLETPIPDTTTVIGVPSWIVGLIVAFVLLIWWMLNHSVQLRQRLNPGIAIEFQGKAPWVQPIKAYTNSRDFPYGRVRTNAIWVRFQVVNTTPETVARGCEAFLGKVSRKNEDGEFIQITSGDSLRLPWSAKPQDKIHSEISIPYGVDTFCDLLSVDEEHNKVFVKWDVHLNVNLGILDQNGTYRFDVVAISAIGGPVTRSIYVKWPGQWDQIKTWSD